MCQLFSVDDKLTLGFCLDFFSETAPTNVIRFSQISMYFRNLIVSKCRCRSHFNFICVRSLHGNESGSSDTAI